MGLIEKFEKSYKAGINIRTELTNYSSYDLIAVLDKIASLVKGNTKFDDSMQYYDKRRLEVSYGCEKNKDAEPIDFILKKATLYWGDYDIWTAEINSLGIYVKYKSEYGDEEKLLSIEWDLYKSIKYLFE
jgi:hypothetical protein